MDYLKINTNDWSLITGNIHVKRIIATRELSPFEGKRFVNSSDPNVKDAHYVELAMLMKMQFCQPFDTTCAVRDE
ncbi:MAG: hypothetical protein ACTS4X_00260 [Candidatus Hodgkinia cicadicola]